MPRHVKMQLGSESVDGEELDFEPLKESWNEYRCEDGSYIKLKVVVSRIIRLEKKNEQTGEPVYQIVSANVVAATPPPTG
jgi:hypothetical protein